MRRVRIFFVLSVLLLTVVAVTSVAASPDAQSPQPERVTIVAGDELELVGNYFAPHLAEGETVAPGVLLMHHSGSRKESWGDFIQPLLDAGYAVLSVDLRGHGESGRSVDWDLAVDDTQRWLTWLGDRAEVDPEALSIVGASIGGDLGLNVMAIDERIQTIVVISPAVEVQGVTTDDAIVDIAGRPVFLITGVDDDFSYEAVIELFPLMTGDSQVRLYDTGVCCTFLFLAEDSAASDIIAWLDTYGR